MKERYGQSDMQKAANRLNFNQAEEEYGPTARARDAGDVRGDGGGER